MSKTDNDNVKEDNTNNEPQPNKSARFAAGQSKFISWILAYLYKSIHSPDVKVDPFDSMVMKAHYNFTSHLLITLFTFVTSHWLVEEPIICVDQHDKSSADEDMLDICLTYPYVEFPAEGDRNNMERRYALYYKWVHIACLILSFLFKAVLLAKSIFSFKNHTEMLQKVSETKVKDRLWVAKSYYKNFKGCHNNMYARFMYAHLAALFVNTICFFGLNITFQNNYWDMPTKLFVQRDPEKFHDEFSLIFPPFANCDITPINHILVDRSMWYGCHLTLNEMYEKIFMMFWFWQVFLMIWTILYIIYYIPFPFCFKWRLYLLNSSRFNKYDPYSRCVKILSIDDSFALRSVSSYLLGKDYAELLSSLMHQKRRKLSNASSKSSKSSNDPNDTIYYDDESQMKSATCHDTSMDRTTFYSCEKEGSSDKLSKGAIGFEALGASPTLKGLGKLISNKFGGSATSLDIAKNARDEHWRKRLSIEFDDNVIQPPETLQHKVSPFLNYLCVDKVGSAASNENDFNLDTPKNERSSSTKRKSNKYMENFLGPGSSSRYCSTPKYDLDNESTLPVDANASPFVENMSYLLRKKLESKFPGNIDFLLDDSTPTKEYLTPTKDPDWLEERPRPRHIKPKPKPKAMKKPSAPEKSDLSDYSEDDYSAKKHSKLSLKKEKEERELEPEEKEEKKEKVFKRSTSRTKKPRK